jgi:hypothetical protein
MTSICNILMKEKAGRTTDNQCHLGTKENQEAADIIATVAASVREDWHFTCKDIKNRRTVEALQFFLLQFLILANIIELILRNFVRDTEGIGSAPLLVSYWLEAISRGQ